MTIIVTIADATHAVHAGGEVERKSASIEIPDDAVPAILREYFELKAKEKSGNWCYLSASFSLLSE